MSLRQLPIFISHESSDASLCEACGAPFSCGAAADACWCAGIKLDGETRRLLRTRYRRCLCRACLESFARTPEQGAADAVAHARARVEEDDEEAAEQRPL